MDLLAIARRLEAIQAEVVRQLASDSEPVAGGWMASNGPGSYLNKAVALGFGAEPTEEDVGRIERFFASRGIEPKVELTQFAPVAFLRMLADHGFVLQEFENTLVLPLRGLPAPRSLLPGGWPEGVRIERIDSRDERQMDIFVRTSASGFIPDGEEISEEYLRTGGKAARAPEHDSYVAYVGNEVAGAGGCGTRHGVTSLFGTSVLPPLPRRGVQQAPLAVRPPPAPPARPGPP